MSIVSRRAVLLVLASLLTSCASLGSGMFGGSEARTRYDRAVSALDQGDYLAARQELAWLVGRCEAGTTGRRALLLFASAELDVRNAAGSANEGARLAKAYLDLSTPTDPDVPIARTLYLLALDLGGAPGYVPDQVDASSANPVIVAESFVDCGRTARPRASATIPEYTGTPAGAHIDALRAELRARTDSLSQARDSLSTQAQRIQELEAEIERIRKLLRGGGGPHPSPQR